MSDEKEKRQALFEELRSNQPVAGSILSSIDGEDIVLKVRKRPDEGEVKTAIFCKAVVNVERRGWFLSDGEAGITCMILPYAQKSLRKDDRGRLVVSSIKVVRYSQNGRFTLCEVID